ncbi:50S ribosomal protein L4, partial [Candidatus Woesearchaeota archaeon]|nr:50S ribosomal protein L4 [Candidatus Woesearchaeota archaeon]
TRGRKYKKKKGILFVVSKDCSLEKAARNIPGIDIAVVNSLNAKLLAPGAVPGRLTLFTEAAIDKLEKEKLFM